jgi:hypothetical protein
VKNLIFVMMIQMNFILYKHPALSEESNITADDRVSHYSIEETENNFYFLEIDKRLSFSNPILK